MKKIVQVLAASCFLLQFAAAADSKILLFSKTAGWRHDSIETAVKALTEHAEQQGVQAVATEDASMFTAKQLAEYSAVVFLLTSQDVLNDEQQKAFESYIQAGGGFVGVHSASDTEYDWPWFAKLVGGNFAGHPNNPNVRSGKMFVIDKHHQSTRMLPDIWKRVDEWYDFKNFNSGVSVLINADEKSYKRPEERPLAEPKPIAWYHNFDGGRAFYTGLGHTKESYAEPLFMQHLWGGVEFALGTKAK